MFEKASRLKIRFESNQGLLTVEDLWEVPLVNKGRNSYSSLDSIAKSVHKRLKDTEEESFVVKKTTVNVGLQLKMDILKHIIETKLQDIEDAGARSDKADRREVLKGIIAVKEQGVLMDKSVDELKEELVSIS